MFLVIECCLFFVDFSALRLPEMTWSVLNCPRKIQYKNPIQRSRATTRDKLKGINGPKFEVLQIFSQIFMFWCQFSHKIRRAQEGCGGLGGENPAAFPQARPIFQQPFSLPESAQTLAGIAFRAAGKSVRNFPAASRFARKLFQQGISDSHSLLELSDRNAAFFGRILLIVTTRRTNGILASKKYPILTFFQRFKVFWRDTCPMLPNPDNPHPLN